MIQLTTEPEQELHVLSLLIRERVRAALATPEGQSRARKLKATVGFIAGGMESRLRFDGRSVHLEQSDAQKADVRTEGTLASFLAICRGNIGMMNVVRRHVRVRGNPLALMKTLPLLRIENDPAEAHY